MQFTVNGHQAYAYTGGKPFDPALPCVVFVHGAMHDHSVWTLLARWCAHHGYGVMAVDHPGHGRSGGAPLASVEALADWVVALLDAAGVKQATVVGHSLGSLIALECGARAPERVSRLVMIATAFPMKVSEALLNTAREEPLKAIDMVNAFSHSTIGAKPAYPGPGSWLHGANRALMRRLQAAQTGVNLFENDFQVCDSYAGGLVAAERVQCPVTVVLGELDAMTAPKSGRSLAQALKARVITVPAGHALMQEAPDEVLGALQVSLATN